MELNPELLTEEKSAEAVLLWIKLVAALAEEGIELELLDHSLPIAVILDHLDPVAVPE